MYVHTSEKKEQRENGRIQDLFLRCFNWCRANKEKSKRRTFQPGLVIVVEIESWGIALISLEYVLSPTLLTAVTT